MRRKCQTTPRRKRTPPGFQVQWNHVLFAEGNLADFLKRRWKTALGEARLATRPAKQKTSPQRTCGNKSGRVPRKIINRYRLQIPLLSLNIKIVEHGWVEKPRSLAEPPKPRKRKDYKDYEEYLRAQIAHINARIAYFNAELQRLASRRSYIIIRIPFRGDESLLRYRPAGCTGTPPGGWLGEQAILMRFERQGAEDKAWKSVMRIAVLTIMLFLAAATEPVTRFNKQLARL